MLARTPLALACTVLLGGCVSTVSIDVDDGSGFTQLATSIPLGDNSQTRLRLRWAEVGGEDSQSLDFGERIQVGNSSISGPAELDVEIDLSYYSIAIGGESDAHQGLKSSVYFGIAQTRFDLTLAGENSRLRDSDETIEAYFQFGFAAAIAASMDLGFSGAFSLGRDLSGISEIDLKLDYRPAAPLILSGGYRWFEYQYGPGNEDSNIEAAFRGPFIGVYLPF
jgi:hypothetical protein